MNSRRIVLLVALLLALGSGFLTIRYLQSVQPKSVAQVELKTVVVSDRLIPPHTKITPDMLQTTSRPVDSLEPDAISDPKEIAGTVSLIEIPDSSVLTHSKIGQPAQLGLTASLRPGERAISIPVDRVKAVAGLIQPGDRVDVIAVPPRDDTSTMHAFAILRGVRVLALGSQTEQNVGATPSPDNQSAGTATLAVTPQQAEELAAADMNAQLRLALRSPLEALVASLPAEPLRSSPRSPQGAAEQTRVQAPRHARSYRSCGRRHHRRPPHLRLAELTTSERERSETGPPNAADYLSSGQREGRLRRNEHLHRGRTHDSSHRIDRDRRCGPVRPTEHGRSTRRGS